MLAVETVGLTRTYANGAEALRGIDLRVEAGEFFCLVGPNGAGKTTLARVLGTQLAPSTGMVRLFGLDLETHLRAIRTRLACVPQGALPDMQLKVWEHVYYFLVARGAARAAARRSTDAVLEQLGLADRSSAKVGELSGGMRRRVLLAIALASGGDLLLLDEPTTGVDLLARRQTWDCLARLKGSASLVMTTHSMEEAEALADRVAIVNRGRVIAMGRPQELKALAPSREKVVMDEASISRALLQPFGEVQLCAGKWAVFPREHEALRRLVDMLMARSIATSVLGTSLEDVFVHLVAADGQSQPEGEG